MNRPRVALASQAFAHDAGLARTDVALGRAGAAVTRVRQEIGLAAVGRVVVAVGKPWKTRVRALAGLAHRTAGRGLRRRARTPAPALAAVPSIRLHVDAIAATVDGAGRAEATAALTRLTGGALVTARSAVL